MSVADKVLANIDENELIEITRQTIRIPTPNPPGEYGEISQLMKKLYEDIGLKVEMVGASREKIEALHLTYPRPNVIAFYEGVKKHPVLCIDTHMDTFPEGNRAAWKYDPFKGEVADGRIYGRGTADCKGFFAPQIVALKAVLNAGVNLQGSVLLTATVDDEIAAWTGMGYLMDEGFESVKFPKPDYHMFGKPTGLEELKGAFKGRLWLRISVKGKLSHGGMPEEGVNAIDNMMEFLRMFKKTKLAKHPLCGVDTVNLGTIHGGTRINLVPDKCAVEIDIRLVPPSKTSRIKKQLESTIKQIKRKNVKFEIDEITIIDDRDSYEIGRNHPFVKKVMANGKRVIGKMPAYAGMFTSGNLYWTARQGIPGVMYSGGDFSRIHKENEFLTVRESVDTAKLYALTILDICGVKQHNPS
jgi:succinyl-diaminopimelate desuccinylase